MTYWSNTKIADKVRGTKKLKFGTCEEWRDWRKLARTSHPVRYWIAEEAFTSLQNVWSWIPDRVNDIRIYLNNRFLVRSHALTANPRDIKPGQWCDVSSRFLPCLFNELVNFVEVEKAWMSVVWDKEAREQYVMPWWRGKWWARWFKEWRCPEAGIAHLKWEMALLDDFPQSPTYKQLSKQAIAAKEVYDLYMWWTVDYRNRVDPFDESGLTEWYDTQPEDEDDLLGLGSPKTPEARAAYDAMSDARLQLEQQYYDEDTQMMKRLIEARGSLWT